MKINLKFKLFQLLFVSLVIAPCVQGQIVESIKNVDTLNHDELYRVITMLVGEGFDPNRDYSLYINIVGSAHGACGNPETRFNTFKGLCRVRFGAMYPTNSGTDGGGNTFLGYCDSQDIWDQVGDGNLYDQASNEIVGYYENFRDSIVLNPVHGSATTTPKYLPLTIKIHYGRRKPDCQECGPSGCQTVQSWLKSVNVKINLGKDSYGNAENSLRLRSPLPNPYLSQPEMLTVVTGTNAEVIRTNTMILRQVKVPPILADIVVSNSYRYDIKFYYTNDLAANKDTNGYYVPTNPPYRIVTIENPDTTNSNNKLNVSEIINGTTNLTKYSWNGTDKWTYEPPGALRKETLTRAWNSNNTERTEVRTVLQPTNDATVYQEQKKYRVYPWGEQLVELLVDTNGARLTSTWEYYTNGADGTYSQLKQRTDPSGYWERYEYDSGYRETNRVMAYLNATNGAPADQCRQLITMYRSDILVVTNIENLLGQEIGRRYKYYGVDQVQEMQCQTPGATTNAADNLVTTTLIYPIDDAFKGELKSIKYPDGTMAFYSYATNNNQKTTTISVGQTNSTGTAISEGTKTVTVVGWMGEMLSRTVTNITASADGIQLSSESYSYPPTDTFKLSPRTTFVDGTSNQVNYGCCTIDNTVDRDGAYTYFSHDALKRQTATTRNSIASSNILNAAGNPLKTLRIGSDSSQITLNQFVYDLAGRVTKETNALNGVTTISYFYDASGQLIKTNIFPDGGLRIETYYMDGSLKGITGSAVHPMRFEYGVISEGGSYHPYSKEIKLDASGTDTSEWTTNYVDAVGRNYKTVFAASAGPFPSRQSYFNNVGQLAREVDPDGVTTLYQYNGQGESEFTALSADQSSSINWNTDRITRTLRDVTTVTGTNVVRSRTFAYATNNSTVSNLVSESWVSTDGRRAWDIRFGLTNQSVSFYPGSGYTVTTNVAPDGSFAISTNYQGQLLSMTRKDAGGNQIGQTSYVYDSHGRQRYVTDARTGTTTYLFDNADEVSSITTPAPGTGDAPQTTSFSYDTLGRLTSSVLPDGGGTASEYYLSGELKKTSGTRTYPVGYSYDPQGRLKTMTNWTAYPSAGARVTTWNYNGYRGFLSSKDYPGTNGPSYTYSAAGRLKTRVWARGTTTTYTNSLSGNLVGIGYSDGTTSNVVFSLDRLGRATTVVDGAGAHLLAYHDSGLLLSETNSSGLLAGFRVTNGFDAFLRRSQLAFQTNGANAFTHSFAYDGASRLTNVSDGTYSGGYSYLANSPMISQTLFQQSGTTRMTTSKQYDNLNRLQSIGSTGSVTVSSAYAYNDANQRTRNIQPDNSFWLYGYDTLGQVTSGKKYWSDWTPVAGQQFEYAFDEIGNRASTKAGGDANGGNLRSANYSVNSLNQYTSRDVPGAADVIGIAHALATTTVNAQSTYRKGEYYQKAISIANSTTNVYQSTTNQAVYSGATNSVIGNIFLSKATESFGYDADGNQASDGRWTLTWDGENRLVQMVSSNVVDGAKKKLDFAYDWRGRRMSKVVSGWNGSSFTAQSTNRYVYDGWNLIAILNPPSSILQSLLWGLDLSGTLQGAGGVGGLIALNSATGGVHFVSYDGNGNVSALVSGTNGAVSGQFEYGPFGEVVRASGSMAKANPFRFSTKYQDDESDFLYYGYRFYNPSTGRWLTQDPSGELGGINLYQFVRSDPVGFADANGLAIYRHEPGEFPSLVGPASYVYGETKFERYVQAPLLNGISTLANTPAAIIGFLDWASQRSGMDRWLGMQPSDMLNAMPPLAAEANLLKAHRASVICRAAKAPETGVGMARLLLSGPQKEAFQQVTRFAEGMRMGNANLIYDELATLAQTQAGRQQLLEIHQAVTQIIPMSIGGERTSILVNLQQVTGVLARGGR